MVSAHGDCHREPEYTVLQRKTDCNTFTHRWDIYITDFPPKDRGDRGRRGEKNVRDIDGDDYKEIVFSGHTRAAAHMHSQRLSAQIRLARIRADRVPARRPGYCHRGAVCEAELYLSDY